MDNGASSYRRYLDGDEDAFEQIVKDYFDNLVFFIDRYVCDTAAAEDIAIDVFTDLVVHRHRYNFSVTLKTYLFMVGRSRALNYIKRQGRIPEEPLTEAMPSGSLTLEDSLIAEQKKRAVNAALKCLNGEMRTVVHLCYFEDLSCEEAAKVMKKNRKQVYNLLYRAKQALRAVLEEEDVL